MTICICRNVCFSTTLEYMKDTDILKHECVNISVFHIVACIFMYISKCRCVCVLVVVLTYMLISMYMLLVCLGV